MHRRSFFRLICLNALCLPLMAQGSHDDQRLEDVTSMKELITLLFGNSKIVTDTSITIKVPRVAANGGSVPIAILSKKHFKRIVVTAPNMKHPLIGIFEVPDGAIIRYFLRAKLYLSYRTTPIVVFAVDSHNNVYRNESKFDILPAGGCEG